MRVAGVEPTNNAAERALRRAVLWRRKPLGTQSEMGSRFVELILTAVTSLAATEARRAEVSHRNVRFAQGNRLPVNLLIAL